jgi:hypothetical protein
VLLYVFCSIYALALLLWLTGTLGWTGTENAPLSGVFLVILGQPWVRWVDSLLPEALWPAGAALAPAINALIIFAICRLLAMNQ